jgi:hypothetical protein
MDKKMQAQVDDAISFLDDGIGDMTYTPEESLEMYEALIEHCNASCEGLKDDIRKEGDTLGVLDES